MGGWQEGQEERMRREKQRWLRTPWELLDREKTMQELGIEESRRAEPDPARMRRDSGTGRTH